MMDGLSIRRPFQNLSYRYKVPLALAVAIFATELVVTVTLVQLSYLGMRQDVRQGAEDLTRVLAMTVRESLVRDDLWRVFEAIRIPIDARDAASGLDAILVLDQNGAIYAASDPRRFPVSASPNGLPDSSHEAIHRLQMGDRFYFNFPGLLTDKTATAAAAVQSEDSGLAGYVLVLYDVTAWRDRVYALIERVLLISVPGAALLLLLGWLWGDRIARPLLSLANAMERMRSEPTSIVRQSLDTGGKDEIGLLRKQFGGMLAQLEEKEALERDMIAAERLAAVGRVSAGVAHEINNPLGGMLNALDTLDRHGPPDELTSKTIGLLRRGLGQIRQTVSALLVEARLDSLEMGPADWVDLRTLIEPELAPRHVQLLWDVPVDGTLPLPAHLVRQLTLNLLLNAKKAVEAGGVVSCSAREMDENLVIEVSNSGLHIPQDALPHLFEPYRTDSQSSHRSYGLGLWVTYQIVTQLRGTVEVISEPGFTCFKVALPLTAVAAEV